MVLELAEQALGIQRYIRDIRIQVVQGYVEVLAMIAERCARVQFCRHMQTSQRMRKVESFPLQAEIDQIGAGRCYAQVFQRQGKCVGGKPPVHPEIVQFQTEVLHLRVQYILLQAELAGEQQVVEANAGMHGISLRSVHYAWPVAYAQGAQM